MILCQDYGNNGKSRGRRSFTNAAITRSYYGAFLVYFRSAASHTKKCGVAAVGVDCFVSYFFAYLTKRTLASEDNDENAFSIIR